MENATSITMNIPNGGAGQKVTFHQSKGLGLPPIPGLSADVMVKVNLAQVKILPYEKDLHKWIGASEKNAQLFLENPIKALEAANLGVQQDVLNELRAISNLVLNTLKK